MAESIGAIDEGGAGGSGDGALESGTHVTGGNRALTVPSVHMNGTSREELLRQVQAAGHAVWQARDALAKASPNARDYYPQGALAYPVARAEHDRRARVLLEVEEELSRLAEAIANG